MFARSSNPDFVIHQASPILFNWRGHILVRYGLLMGASYLAMSLLVVSLHSALRRDPADAAVGCLQLTLAAIAGARLLSLLCEDGLPKLRTCPAAAILRPGFWLHGGMMGAALAVYCRYRADPPALFAFLDALGLSLPLFEVLSRLGCHSYGCCFGKRCHAGSHCFRGLAVQYTHPCHAVVRLCPHLKGQSLFPAQLLSAALFLCQYAASVALLWLLHTAGVTSVAAGGPLAASLVCHSAVRTLTEQYRADFRGSALGGLLSTTACISVLLAGVGLALHRYAAALGLSYPTAALAAGASLRGGALKRALRDGGAAAVLPLCGAWAAATAAYGYHRKAVGRWV